jgi:hypothetical protein
VSQAALPDGTRFVLPDTAAIRDELRDLLRDLYHAWGFDQVEVPSLERYDPHPRAAQSFKLADRDSGVLALRTDFTPALAQLVRATHPAVAGGARRPVRYQYAGTVWHAIDPELARTREFTQVGIELIGVSNARADAELIHLARESVRVVGLEPRVEVGNPGFVRAAFDAAGVPGALRDLAADAIDRKDRSDLSGLLAPLGLARPAWTRCSRSPTCTAAPRCWRTRARRSRGPPRCASSSGSRACSARVRGRQRADARPVDGAAPQLLHGRHVPRLHARLRPAAARRRPLRRCAAARRGGLLARPRAPACGPSRDGAASARPIRSSSRSTTPARGACAPRACAWCGRSHAEPEAVRREARDLGIPFVLVDGGSRRSTTPPPTRLRASRRALADGAGA